MVLRQGAGGETAGVLVGEYHERVPVVLVAAAAAIDDDDDATANADTEVDNDDPLFFKSFFAFFNIPLLTARQRLNEFDSFFICNASSNGP